MTSYQVFKVFNQDNSISADYVMEKMPALNQDEVLIKVWYSGINFKDALGVTGKGKIYKKFPIVGGIDASGVVAQSNHKDFKEGDKVLVTGCGLGEESDGGYGEYVKVPGSWVVPLPGQLSLKEAMILGTAGFTAALCIHRLEQNMLSPESGPILVTGASGGVGSFSLNMLSGLGYEVVACSGRETLHSYLKSLGAREILAPDVLTSKSRPLEKGLWGGAIDNIGASALAGILSSVRLWGSVASVGLAMGHELHTTVMPFILRGVSLIGISSANCPMALRKIIWQRLAGELKPGQMEQILQKEIPFDQLHSSFEPFMNRGIHGRHIVKIGG